MLSFFSRWATLYERGEVSRHNPPSPHLFLPMRLISNCRAVNWRQEVNTPMTQSPPVPTSSATLSTTIRTDYSCDGTTFFGALGNLYSSLSTDPSLQCQCEKTAYEWLFTSDPATITRTRVNANGLTTFTSTVSGTVTTITSQLLSTTTIVKTPGLGAGNDAGGTVNGDWIGTAKPPCVRSFSS